MRKGVTENLCAKFRSSTMTGTQLYITHTYEYIKTHSFINDSFLLNTNKSVKSKILISVYGNIRIKIVLMGQLRFYHPFKIFREEQK